MDQVLKKMGAECRKAHACMESRKGLDHKWSVVVTLPCTLQKASSSDLLVIRQQLLLVVPRLPINEPSLGQDKLTDLMNNGHQLDAHQQAFARVYPNFSLAKFVQPTDPSKF